MPPDQLLKIQDLRMSYATERGMVRAVDGVDLEIRRNEALVVLGESGCGKSSLAKALLRILPRNACPPTGQVLLDGVNILALPEERFRREVRWLRLALVMQAAMNALNPVVRIGEQVAEPLRIHRGWSRRQAAGKAAAAFEEVGISPDFLARYPHELSGGMRQRAVLAMALIAEPDLVILDEPTSALDVLTQAAIMNVLKRIKRERGTSFVLITHDVATSSELADRVALMYAGQVVEEASAEIFFSRPAHPYSQMLMAAVPKLHQREKPVGIPGRPPSLLEPPAGCRFGGRCPHHSPACVEVPAMVELAGRHRVRCRLQLAGGAP
ncbi:ABC transporter ATP-binding protein [Desulfurivibrio alkaliphilus]|uniref:Oligopeptide/dipeptide ABC transporter, ATPase subunit n=1 Tax=Desulfurivibrio alkaliphilus (strain DSM 19089 / UNIQEM U267 / AHT2) TaxID=589865 RepID=D6Z0K4_DESAT|nr:ABC transporter ATP-binding protein [Desulfurivibrio alkaliphilus]ADH85233.1 oligopeptide/dipeptide ABC transporter, ATPase subunit [Desulfurivibrio alkaliphilus AHT 2]